MIEEGFAEFDVSRDYRETYMWKEVVVVQVEGVVGVFGTVAVVVVEAVLRMGAGSFVDSVVVQEACDLVAIAGIGSLKTGVVAQNVEDIPTVLAALAEIQKLPGIEVGEETVRVEVESAEENHKVYGDLLQDGTDLQANLEKLGVAVAAKGEDFVHIVERRVRSWEKKEPKQTEVG